MDYLCSSTDIARSLRITHTFKIVPMINPDGVIFGNFRTGLAGKDLNRCFNKTD